MKHIPHLILATLACVLPARGALAQQLQRPNILFILADDLRPEIGCYGSPAKTPHIDSLARRGMRFDRAYCQFPICNPSRVSLLTGLSPDTTRILENDTHFRSTLPDVITLPQLFKQKGYFTASLGKIFHRGLNMEDIRPEMDDAKTWNISRYYQSTKRGLEGEGRNLTAGKLPWCRWLAADGDDEDQPDGQIARDAIKMLEEKRDRPFFLGVGFHKPHDPFIAPKRYFDMYPLDSLKLSDDRGPLAGDPPIAIGSAWLNQFNQFTDNDRRQFLRSYYAGVSFMDAQLGKILAAVDRLGLMDNTIILFLGDHGFHLGERGWWNKGTLYELSARAPLIVYTPAMKAAGQSCTRLVEFVDLYPTLLELCNLRESAPPTLQGQSFASLLSNPNAPSKFAAYTQLQRGKLAGRSVRTERWRYTEWDAGRQGKELFDHAADPDERVNLAADPRHADTIAQLSRLLNSPVAVDRR